MKPLIIPKNRLFLKSIKDYPPVGAAAAFTSSSGFFWELEELSGSFYF
jgi:hypothetical protein